VFAVALTAPDASRADDSATPEPALAKPAPRTPDAAPGAAPAPPGAPAPAGEPGPPACAAAGEADAGPPDDSPLPDEAGDDEDAGDDDIDRGIICPIIDEGLPPDEAGEPPDDGADDIGGDECAGDGKGLSGLAAAASFGSSAFGFRVGFSACFASP